VAGALLVAPPDIDGPAFPVDAVGFTVPAPGPLPFAAVLVASSNDPYCTPEHAGDLAEEWGATLVDIGAHGHVNVASGFGPWPEGRRLLDGFVESLAVAAAARTRFAEA
jgi:predicted alpha/beta hydrolase family esterase